MKKLIISLTAVLIALLVCFSVLADNSTPAAELYDSLVKTLFHTDNVTLTGTAKFSLDGVWFKTAEITLKQDGNRAFREMKLRGPCPGRSAVPFQGICESAMYALPFRPYCKNRA